MGPATQGTNGGEVTLNRFSNSPKALDAEFSRRDERGEVPRPFVELRCHLSYSRRRRRANGEKFLNRRPEPSKRSPKAAIFDGSPPRAADRPLRGNPPVTTRTPASRRPAHRSDAVASPLGRKNNSAPAARQNRWPRQSLAKNPCNRRNQPDAMTRWPRCEGFLGAEPITIQELGASTNRNGTRRRPAALDRGETRARKSTLGNRR